MFTNLVSVTGTQNYTFRATQTGIGVWEVISPNTHSHPISEVTNLQPALDGKQIKTVYSDTAPSHSAGLEWVDTTDLRSYRSYDNLWVEIDRA